MTTKTCIGCSRNLPLNQFLKASHHTDGLSSRCRSCVYVQRKGAQKKWRDSHKADLADYQRDYQLNWRLKRKGLDISAVPPPPTEPCKLHPHKRHSFYVDEMVWKCACCAVKLPEDVQRAKNRVWRRTTNFNSTTKKLMRRADALESLHGKDYADAFRCAVAKRTRQRPNNINGDFFIERQLLFERVFAQPMSTQQIRRVMELNRAARQLPIAKTWQCARCALVTDLPYFLDIEHINPRCIGGKNDPSNLQLMCPNCHRLKSISEKADYHTERVAKQTAA